MILALRRRWSIPRFTPKPIPKSPLAHFAITLTETLTNSFRRRARWILAVLLAVAAPLAGAGLSAASIHRSPGLGLVHPEAAAGSASPVPALHPPRRNRALDRKIDALLGTSDAQRGFWGLEVVDLKSARVLYARNADHLFLPASNMKMYTTAAALEKLGPDYVFHTTVEGDAAPDAAGRVGNLYLVGRGDPNLGVRTFPYTYHGLRQPADMALQELADKLQARGVREVTGNLIADDSYFAFEPFAPNWEAEDLEWGYGAPVTAWVFNDNLLTLHIKPGPSAGDMANLTLEPVADYYQIKNRVTTSAAGTAKNYSLERLPGAMELDVWGQFPAGAREDAETISIANPPQLVAHLFRQMLEARGITVKGQVEVRDASLEDAASPSGPPPAPHVVLAEHLSPPLREAIKAINKESENLHAELLLRTLGHLLNNTGSLSAGLEELDQFASQQAGILPGETYFTDGSGLSRADLVAPNATIKLLLYMAHSPNFPAFFDSLPVAGVDGTLAHRFTTDEFKGRIHAKTGTVGHVNALSGFMDLPSGRRLVFSLMTNNHPLSSRNGQETLDEVAQEIFKYYATRR